MLHVTLKDTLHHGDKLYWKGVVYGIERVHSQSSLYDLALCCNGKIVWWLDKVYYRRESDDHYYRVCNSNGDYLGRLEQYQFNVVNKSNK